MTNEISKTKFAELLNVSKPYVSGLISRGKIKTTSKERNANIDLDDPLTQEFIRKKKVTIPFPKDNRTDLTGVPTSRSKPSGKKDESQLDKHELDKILVQERIEQTRIKNEQLRATLIPKDLVEKVFGRIHQIDDAQFKTLGYSTTPKIISLVDEDNFLKAEKIISVFGLKNDSDTKTSILSILDSSGKIEKGLLEINEDATGGILKNIKREIDEFLKTCDELANKND